MKNKILLFLCFIFSSPVYAIDMPDIHGFVEVLYAPRVSKDKLTKHGSYVALEERLQLKTRYAFNDGWLAEKNSVINFKGDLVADNYFDNSFMQKIRELNLSFSPVSFMDVKIGRQVLTWGVADYLFVNDLFPKDYVSFYTGRDDEYLKAPSDAARISFYPQLANIDFVVFGFDPNILPKGDRLSMFDSFQGGIAGRNSERYLVKPKRTAHNLQYALRAYRNFGNVEGALYTYRGFDPIARSYLNELNRELFYSRLDAYGLSLRSPIFSGLGSFEMGYYHSPQDSAGTNRLIENSSYKILFGYEKDLGNDLKASVQYLYEEKLNYSDYIGALMPWDYFWDSRRHVVTQGLTKLYKNQTVRLSLFNFYSPSDKDGYLRASISYDITDAFKVTFGANMPWGEDNKTEFGQMQKNKNIFVRARYSF